MTVRHDGQISAMVQRLRRREMQGSLIDFYGKKAGDLSDYLIGLRILAP
jgi:hypothetical protein